MCILLANPKASPHCNCGLELALLAGVDLFGMPAGLSTWSHAQNGNEKFLMVESTLIDNDGTQFREVDVVRLQSGTKHSPYTPNGCLLTINIAGADKILE